jgi:hypothetical protein
MYDGQAKNEKQCCRTSCWAARDWIVFSYLKIWMEKGKAHSDRSVDSLFPAPMGWTYIAPVEHVKPMDYGTSPRRNTRVFPSV